MSEKTKESEAKLSKQLDEFINQVDLLANMHGIDNFLIVSQVINSEENIAGLQLRHKKTLNETASMLGASFHQCDDFLKFLEVTIASYKQFAPEMYGHLQILENMSPEAKKRYYDQLKNRKKL